MSEEIIQNHVQSLYGRVSKMWLQHRDDLFAGACGYDVLSGPPIHRPTVMIIGANPGFGVKDDTPGEDKTWPLRSYIGDATWALARKLRGLFAEAGRPDALDRAVQTNFLFFKSSSIERDEDSRYPWKDVAPAVRSKLERWSAGEVEALIRVSEPEMILVLGLGPFDAHARDQKTILMDRSGRRRLLVEGTLADRRAIGILHPTGAQVAGEDWSRVSAHLAHLLC